MTPETGGWVGGVTLVLVQRSLINLVEIGPVVYARLKGIGTNRLLDWSSGLCMIEGHR